MNRYKIDIRYIIFSSVILMQCLLLNYNLSAQPGKTEEPVNKYRLERLAGYAFETGNYYQAIELYIQLKESGNDYAKTNYLIAESYAAVREYNGALKFYKETMKKDEKAYPDSRFKYAMMLKMTGRYDEASREFSDLAKNYRGENQQLVQARAKKEVANCKFALETIRDSVRVSIKHLDAAVNSGNSDFAPMLYDSNQIVFSSLPAPGPVTINEKEPVFVKLYIATKNRNGDYVKHEFAEGPFNGFNSHTANGALSPDKRRFYFTRCTENKNKKMICAIYVSEKKSDKWQEPVMLGKEINFPEYTSTHPNLAKIKKDEILFFVSDRIGSAGGKDIWFSVYKNGQYTPARNLGPKINTLSDEITPFYDEKEQTLYFSSDGKENIGGFDIFKSKGTTTRWANAENAGYPLNSAADDFYFVLSHKNGEGYFVSNRPCSKELKTCCDDIYRYRMTDIISDDEKISKPEDITTIPKLELSETTESEMEPDTTRIAFSESKKIEKDKIYTLKNVYFDFDDAALTSVAQDEIDRLVAMLKQIPDIKIELSAHTDSRGTEEYNNSLSQKRAESVVKYLIKKGVDKKRMTAKGYGELLPIAPNEKDDGSDNPEGRKINRRIEVRIVD